MKNNKEYIIRFKIKSFVDFKEVIYKKTKVSARSQKEAIKRVVDDNFSNETLIVILNVTEILQLEDLNLNELYFEKRKKPTTLLDWYIEEIIYNSLEGMGTELGVVLKELEPRLEVVKQAIKDDKLSRTKVNSMLEYVSYGTGHKFSKIYNFVTIAEKELKKQKQKEKKGE